MDGDVWQSSSRFRLTQLLLKDLRDPEWTDTKGYRPKVLILDNEFIGLNLDGPITQTSLLDLCTNEMLVDVCIKREPEKLVPKDMFGRLDPMAEYLYKSKYRSSTADRHVYSAYESSKLVKESGITSDDYILEWSLHPLDLPRLRLMLFNFGFQNVLPPDTHCVSLIPDFRLNIPNTISLALEFIFPMLHPGHVLVGTNHNSDSDVRMTRLMVLFLLERLDPTIKDTDFLGVWALQTAEERSIRVAVVSERTQRRLAKETPEARRIRLLAKRTRWRARETPERRRIRHAAISEKIEKENPRRATYSKSSQEHKAASKRNPRETESSRGKGRYECKGKESKRDPGSAKHSTRSKIGKSQKEKSKGDFWGMKDSTRKNIGSFQEKQSRRDSRETKHSTRKNIRK